MSDESTTPDLVGLWQEAAHAADRRDLDAAIEFFAPNAVWEVQPLGISHIGAPAIRSFLEDWLGSYEDYETEQEQGHNLGNGVVFAVTRLDARPVGSPSRVQERWGFTVTWAAGMIVRVVGNTDIAEARAAAQRLAESRSVPEESTAPDLVGLVRCAYEASTRRELDTLMSFYGPDSVWDVSPLGLGVYEGLPAIRRFFEDWIGSFEEFEMEPEEILDLGAGVTLAVALQSGRPVGSDGRVQWRCAALTIWVDGVAVRTTNYTDIDEARVAAERLARERG